MRTRTKWLIAGGTAAFVLTPVAAVSGSTTLDDDLPQQGLVVDAQPVGNASTGTKSRTSEETAAPRSDGKAVLTEPSGKKTVSAASPISPRTAPSPKTPASPNSPS